MGVGCCMPGHPGTIISSYRDIATSGAGKLAAMAEEEKKKAKYFQLDLVYAFIPLAIKSLGVISLKSLKFMRNLDLRIRQMTGKVLSHAFFVEPLHGSAERERCTSSGLSVRRRWGRGCVIHIHT